MIQFTDEDEIEAAFQHYRITGFPYPNLTRHEIIHRFRELQATKSKILRARRKHLPGMPNWPRVIGRHSRDQILANYFHPHIYASHAQGMRSPLQSYQIDKSLRKAIQLSLKWFDNADRIAVLRYLQLVNGTQPCSNFRPSAAKAVYDYLGGNDVLDMSTGYGGRLLGFLASSCKGAYTGIDPSRLTYEGNKRIAKEFDVESRVRLILSPFEDVPMSKLPKVDVAFTSPPYFGKEIYDESDDKEKQSRERYLTYAEWVKGFLRPMMKKAIACLRPQGILAINIADISLKSYRYPLIDKTIQIAEAEGFPLADRLELHFGGFGKGLSKTKHEPVLIFRRRLR